MSVSFFRGQFLRLTTTQLRVKHAYGSVSTPYRSFCASPTRERPRSRSLTRVLTGQSSLFCAVYKEGKEENPVSNLTRLHEALNAAESSISRQGLEVGGQEDEISLNTTDLVTHQLDLHCSRTFWVNYHRFGEGKDELPDAVTRRSILRRLIRLATTQDEWDALKHIFKVWKENQWGMESVAETALYARATEHSQFALLTHLIREEMIYFPSPRQARQVAHAIIAPRWGRQLLLADRLFHLVKFNDVNSDPRIMREKRSQDRFRSVAANDDIVIGVMMLSLLFQAAGEPTFDVLIRRRLSKTALQLASSLGKRRLRWLDGSGGNSISLTADEKGWAYVATLECSKALELPSVVETLKSVWLESVEATLTRQAEPMWVRQGGLGARANKGWVTHLADIKKWMEEVNLTFEER